MQHQFEYKALVHNLNNYLLKPYRDQPGHIGDYILDKGFPGYFCIKNPERTHWILGWLTGIDNDLICIFPHVKSRDLETHALSPVCSNRFISLLAFLVKRLLFVIDQNLGGL